MKEKSLDSTGNRIAKAVLHGISFIMKIFKKKEEENHVEQPVELSVVQTPMISEVMDDAENTQIPQPTERKKINRLVEHDAGKASELKVVGKIDLDALNQRTRPVKKSRRQLERDRKIRTKK